MNDVSINRQFLEADGDNEEFLEADGDNEERAFELLFNTYHQIVFNKIDKMMRNHLDPAVDADDITNETEVHTLIWATILQS